MILKINNKKHDIAEKIYLLFQDSYKVEAELLKATNFPPLSRSIENLISCCNLFYAFYLDSEIIGVIEIDYSVNRIHIQSLAVSPRYFRRGVGRGLVQFIMNSYESSRFTVETGLGNYPAVKLYKSFGFNEVKKWKTNHNVIKVRFEKLSC